MDAVKYLKTKRRMCETHLDCASCKLAYDKNGHLIDCSELEDYYPEEAAAIVEKWGKENLKIYSDCASCPILDINCYEQCKMKR